ncbi:uncharacterized protein MKZ38_004236 [Zalerion maritima]|uniref:Chromo domain-containing protein n=1 Tax=Zalerion maritima TaxID=339359 RepID=A0AAD5RLL8_9PEZI|nr:uncharacterized protein MKZ38_004236 [Zalerion maritima]
MPRLRKPPMALRKPIYATRTTVRRVRSRKSLTPESSPDVALFDSVDDDPKYGDYQDYDEEDDGQDQSDVGSDAPPQLQNGTKSTEEGDEEEQDEEDEDDDEGEDEFVVEKITNHVIDKDGELRFHVKWEGYDDPTDMTWEPEENLEAAPEILQAYFKKIGGREKLFQEAAKKATANKRKRAGRPSLASTSSDIKKPKKQHPAEKTPPPEQGGQFIPPSGSWEDHIAHIDIMQNEDGNLIVCLNWKSGHKTRHHTSQVYKRCPQQMLRFYEKHVKIIHGGNAEAANESNGDSKMEDASE